MTFVPWMLLLISGTPADRDDVSALVARLGAARYAEREEASQALEKRGREALDALRAAREAKDPEVRSRAAALIEKIESELMVRPTLVRLDFQDRPLPEVVKAIADRSGIPLTLVPQHNRGFATRRVTLQAPAPVPFWIALDRLCKEGRLQHNVAAQVLVSGSRGTTVQLLEGQGAPSLHVSDSGPFRATLLGIHHHRDLALSPNGGMMMGFGPGEGPLPPQPIEGLVRPAGAGRAPAVADSFYLELQVMAEPRMALTQNGPHNLLVADDDTEQSLLPSAPTAGAPRRAGYFGFNVGGTTLQLRSELKYPEHPGRVIKRLHLRVPVIVSARKDEPLTIDLAESKGKTFRNGEVSVVVHDVKPDANNQRTLIELAVRPNAGPTDPSGIAGRFGPEPVAFRGPQMSQNQIEILDAQGRAYQQWFPSSTRMDTEEVRLTLMLMPGDNVGPPAQIRYYDMVRATSEASFTFHDVPMP
jgi:hypothetical protein